MTASELFLAKFASAINKWHLGNHDDTIIVALSGGADSVAMLAALSQLGFRCIAAHCNFHLRGDESNRDAAHARNIAARLGAEFRIIDFDVDSYKKAHGVSTEMACRDLRYEWFHTLSREYGDIDVAVAHHRDDNIETLFLNLLRGTGITGLSAMRPRNGIIIRPMLDISRKEIEEFLTAEKIDYIIDSTNLVNDVKRNKLRNLIIPELIANFPDASTTITTTIENIRENLALYNELVGNFAQKYVNGNIIARDRLKSEVSNSATLLFELLRPYGFNHTQTSDMLSAETGRSFGSDTHRALINRGEIILSSLSDAADDYITLTLPDSNVDWLSAEIIDAENLTFTRNPSIIYLDADALDGNPTFTLRRWQQGDRLEPFGMNGSRLVSDIFSDAKLSIDDKHRQWILTRNNVIIWIVGMRASRHFPITAATKRALKITLKV